MRNRASCSRQDRQREFSQGKSRETQSRPYRFPGPKWLPSCRLEWKSNQEHHEVDGILHVMGRREEKRVGDRQG
ncbi:hypothetical protein FOFC_07010 [Fusarium oxysporum]|nr:hypothetical protein FOFC_07010 [Fusarium oxysporum]